MNLLRFRKIKNILVYNKLTRQLKGCQNTTISCKYQTKYKVLHKMKDIILIGGGGHCKSCIDVIESEAHYKIQGIIDVKEKIGENVLGFPIIASDKDLPVIIQEYDTFLITLGQIKSPKLRIKLFQILKEFNVNLPTIISPYAYVSKYVTIGEGTIIMHQSFINANAQIGNNCIINTGALIEHDVVIEDNCHISTNSVLNGGVKVKNNTFVGSNSMAKENIIIGENSIVGAGVSLLKNLSANSLITIKKESVYLHRINLG